MSDTSGREKEAERAVVAVVLWRGDKIGLLKRSARVTHDRGLWHCVTGYLAPENSPREQAVVEVREETGLCVTEPRGLVSGPAILIDDHVGNRWTVHTFRLRAPVATLSLDWEHEAYQWIRVAEVDGTDHVSWLPEVLAALGFRRGQTPS